LNRLGLLHLPEQLIRVGSSRFRHGVSLAQLG
jgi:hypothetical protein